MADPKSPSTGTSGADPALVDVLSQAKLHVDSALQKLTSGTSLKALSSRLHMLSDTNSGCNTGCGGSGGGSGCLRQD